ncbi:MAG: Gfo/Idh/MocA family oxidoreductase [Povalibacter sp.]
MIRVGLIGFGLAGRYFHAPLITAAGMDLCAVVTSRTQEVRDAFPNVSVVDGVKDFLMRHDIDLIVVASPSQFHFEHAREALSAGKHVVIDKPLSTSPTEANALIELAEQKRRKLSVFQNRRWDGDFLTIRQLLEEQRLGKIAYFRARWDRFRPEIADRWRERAQPGSGMLFDLGSHLIDQALVLFGWPDWVQADVFGQREGSMTDDGFEILMGKGSMRISLGVSSLAAAGDWRYCIHGTRGSFFKAGLDPQEDQARAGLSARDERFGVEAEERFGKLINGVNNDVQIIPTERGSWLTYYERMKQAIEEDAAVPVLAEEARTVLQVIEAARRSSSEGRRILLT